MREEFEEKEKKDPEKNILPSVEDMTDEEFQKFLEEQYIREAEERKKKLFEDQDSEDFEMTDEEVEASYARFVKRLKAEGIYEEPEKSDKTSEEKIRPIKGKHTRKLAKIAGIGVVCALCVFAASMTSEANRNYFINGFRILSGTDTRMVVGNDKKNENVNTDEYQAMADIEEKLGVKVPEFYYRPYGMEFLSYSIDDSVAVARIEYQYDNKIVSFYIDEQSQKASSYIRSVSGENIKTVLATTEGIKVKIEKIEEKGDKLPSYSAKWKRDNVVYYMYGRIEEDELIKIIENMDF